MIDVMIITSSEPNVPLDPSILKHIHVTTDDTRIAMRLSELSTEGLDQYQLESRTNAIKYMRLDLISGQQCARYFFFCIKQAK